MAILAKVSKSDDSGAKVVFLRLSAAFRGFINFRPARLGGETRITHLFQDIPSVGPSLAGLKVTFLVLLRVSGIRPILRQEYPRNPAVPQTGLRAASRTPLLSGIPPSGPGMSPFVTILDHFCRLP